MKLNSIIEQLLKKAIKDRCSDIYILPKGSHYVIKMHYLKGLVNQQSLSKDKAQMIINYFKYHGHMQISEHRRPMMGSLTWQQAQTTYYLRLSTVADFSGEESLVIRIIYPFEQISMNYLIGNQFDLLKKLAKQRGLMLFSGPTGSGKTTTIYHLARQFKQHQIIMSMEDPVEIKEEDFLQLQVNLDAGMSYQELLKVGLRNRPDIFIIGEIRDQETAQMAVQAALSGHLVFSTVHAQHPLGVIDRLQQLGVNDDYLKNSVNSIMYQRLIPTKNEGLATLLSIVEKHQLFSQKIDNDEILSDWRVNLQSAVRAGQINEKTKQQFWFG